MYDVIFRFLEVMSQNFVVTYIVCILLQIILSTRKRCGFGFILPIYTFAVMLFFQFGDMPTYRQATPYMAGLMGLAVWLPLTILLIITFFICRAVLKKRNKNKG